MEVAMSATLPQVLQHCFLCVHEIVPFHYVTVVSIFIIALKHFFKKKFRLRMGCTFAYFKMHV